MCKRFVGGAPEYSTLEEARGTVRANTSNVVKGVVKSRCWKKRSYRNCRDLFPSPVWAMPVSRVVCGLSVVLTSRWRLLSGGALSLAVLELQF